MTVKIEKLDVCLCSMGQTDVDPAFSVEEVRVMYINTYPELA